MTSFDITTALQIPDGARVDRRVPKTLLIKNGAPTAADKRRIREEIDEIRWLATLKPMTVGVAEYRDEAKEYLEIAVLQLTIRPKASTNRLTELVHRAVPYPVLLITQLVDAVALSLAHKRWSQSDTDRTVLDGDLVTATMSNGLTDGFAAAFCDSLAIKRQPRTSLHTLYQGWIDAVLALHAARITGVFSMPMSVAEAEDRALALLEYWRLESQISTLGAAGSQEKQINRLTDINLKLKRLRAELDFARSRL